MDSSRKRCLIQLVLLEDSNNTLNLRALGFGKHCLQLQRARKTRTPVPFASADDGVTVNGSPQASTGTDVEDTRIRLKESVRTEDHSDGLVQFLHDAARVFELSIKERGSFSSIPWFSTSLLGVDKNAWVKELSYQVLSLAFRFFL